MNIEAYIARVGMRKADNTLALLNKLKGFKDAMESDIGREILAYDIECHEKLLEKMYEEKATPQELAELRYLRKRITRIAEKYFAYDKLKKEIEK